MMYSMFECCIIKRFYEYNLYYKKIFLEIENKIIKKCLVMQFSMEKW